MRARHCYAKTKNNNSQDLQPVFVLIPILLFMRIVSVDICALRAVHGRARVQVSLIVEILQTSYLIRA